MGVIDKLNHLLSLFGFGLRGLFRLSIWWPFFIYFLLQAALLLLMNNHTNQYIFPILNPIIELLGETRAELFSHYPGKYLMLPFLFQLLKIGLGIIFEGLAVGLTTALFLNLYYRSNNDILNNKEIFGRWPHLALSWALITAILLVLNYGANILAESYMIGSPRRMMFFDFGLRLATVMIYTPFIYAIPAIVIFKESLLKAIGRSLKLFLKVPIFSFFVTLTAYIFTVPLSWLSSKSGMIISKFSPELVFYILLLSLFVDIVINIVFTGALTRFLAEEKET